MQRLDDDILASATDLIGFLACDHLTMLEIGAAEGRWKRPYRKDPELDLLQRKGDEHEKRVLEKLASKGKDVTEIPFPPYAEGTAALKVAEQRTVEAMRQGEAVIYQGTFFDGRWRGHPDFLIKRDEPSDLGDWSYEVADAKLALRVKAAAILQLCLYSDRLEQLQGRTPHRIWVATGDAALHEHRLADYSAYYRSVKRLFETRVWGSASAPDTYPEPVEHCHVCRWYGVCADRRRDDDHLCRVAGLTRSQIKHLRADGVDTLTKLAESKDSRRVSGLNPAILANAQKQARLQQRHYEDGEVRYELVPPQPVDPDSKDPKERIPRGLSALPEPSTEDIFVDLESDQWAIEGGLEYLVGTLTEGGGASSYKGDWAHSAAEEKAAFESLIDQITAALGRDPKMHVYHYGPYEKVAVKRLMGRYATREDEVDQLLRSATFVDLFRIVKQGVRVSQESYSLKKIEKLYMERREGPVTKAGFSVVEYERWLDERDPKILDGIEAYNKDDCVSILELRRWLENRRAEAEGLFGVTLPRPEKPSAEASEGVTQQAANVKARVDALLKDIPVDSAERTQQQQGSWLLAQLQDWHRREAKPQWWSYFDLLEGPEEELDTSSEALAGLTLVGKIKRVKQSAIYRYRYDPAQDHRIDVGDQPVDPETRRDAGEVVGLDLAEGTIDLKRGIRSKAPHPRNLVPGKPIPTNTMRRALRRVADSVIADGINGNGSYRAARDLLLGLAPRIEGHESGAPLVQPGEDALAAGRRLVHRLTDSYIPIQGPPGTGKTYTGARMITSLVKEGKTVGIAATSHRAITNLVDEVCDAADEDKVRLRIIQRADKEVASKHRSVAATDDNKIVDNCIARGGYQVAAGTAWLFAREAMEGALDVLFIDEAGQMSLANVIAMAGCARSIVLLGDPNQLPQVTQGSHPDGAGASSLEHVLGERATIAPDRGLFIGQSWRMHPRVCDYISEAFYDSRLDSHTSTHGQSIERIGEVGGVGLRLASVMHEGCTARSPEEAKAVKEMVEALLKLSWTDQKGRSGALTPEDILVVAPYNAQVGQLTTELRDLLPASRIGTVDKFQGQEGAVALFSTATSSPEDAPRQMEFLYSRNRLNVAISRARCLAILVSSPALMRVRCRTPQQMRLVNAFCMLAEAAASERQ